MFKMKMPLEAVSENKLKKEDVCPNVEVFFALIISS